MTKEKSKRASSHPDGEPTPIVKGSHVYLIDGSGYIFRAFHALPPLTRPSDGLPVGAVHGFCAMLWKLLKESKVSEAPTHVAVIFDAGRETFRNKIYPEYKAHRPPPPEELVPQFSLIRDAVKAFNVASIEMDGYEADDLIATYARDVVNAGGDVTIISSDKDLMQLVRPGVVMFDGMKAKKIGRDEVFEKFGVWPDKVVDVQSLAGDSTDNVPGVPGIGIKTAAELIHEYGDLDTLLARAGEIKQPKRREKLIEFAEQARISRELVTLKADVPVEIDIDKTGVHEPDPPTLLGFLREMEFNSLTKRIAEGMGVEAPPPLEKSVGSSLNPPPTHAEGVSSTRRGEGLGVGGIPKASNRDSPPPGLPHKGGGEPNAAVAYAAKLAKAAPFDRAKYQTVRNVTDLEKWIAAAHDAGHVAFDTETTGLDAMRADLVGVSLSVKAGQACYVPLAHTDGANDLFGGGGAAPDQLPIRDAIALLKPLLEDDSVLKIGQNLKFDMLVMARHGVTIRNFDDTMLLSYALDGGRAGHGMDDLALRHLNHVCISFDQALEHAPGAKKSEKTFAGVPIPKATEYAAEDADVTLRLWQVLKPRLAAERMTTVYETLERPLVPVIASMEREGIKIDRAILSRLSSTFAQRAARLEEEVNTLAGHKFNLASPKQLGELLFDRLKLPGGKKTKTGQRGPDHDFCE